ncbi:MAG: phenylalanine--tRNA ligase subunit beta [Clostridiales bacterium]|jgi:phenylalanyl-tRNA synthetase beta chain|nr:phenylalanine--tRNA ligase subunit beta [Clostridiales bacterium]
MKLPILWLNDFVDTTGVSVSEICQKLISAGFEIEGIADQRRERRGIYTAEIKSIEKHPKADKLDVCRAASKGGEYTVVTGAKNIKVGDIVPLALDGAVLPDGKTIGNTLFRDVLSEGMFCGGEELNLTESDYKGASFNGVLIFEKGTETGVDINDVLGFDDTVLDVAVTPNRPDCNSVIGLAREVAAVLKRPFKMPALLNDVFHTDCGIYADKNKSGAEKSEISNGGVYADSGKQGTESAEVPGGGRGIGGKNNGIKNQKNTRYNTAENDIINYISVEVKDEVLCPRYTAALVKDVKVFDSPFYIKKRLRSAGIKSINNIVDITNYVLTEIGQPMHAFDLSLLKGAKIVVRRAEENEEIISLDGKTNLLKSDMLVIADAEKASAVAGIMGGLNSGINPDTKNIVFESARFKRDSVRATSKALNLKSDSQARYEKGIDFLSQELAIGRALSLVAELKAGTIVGGVIDSLKTPLKKTVVKTTAQKINDILGIEVPQKTISEILKSLEIQNEIDKDGNLTAEIPLYREDITNANDLAEEVIRLYGYDKIVPTILDGARQTRGGKSGFQKKNEKLKNLLIGGGFNEIISFSFIGGKAFDMLKLPENDIRRNAVKILNPLSEDLSTMRTTLVHSILSAAAYNINKGNDDLRLFESAVVYLPKALPLTELPDERMRLAFCMSGGGVDFYSAKGVIEEIFDIFGTEAAYVKSKESYLHPGRSADLYSEERHIGSVGEVHPEVLKNYGVKEKRVYIAEIDSEYVLDRAPDFRKFRAAPKYPAVERDLALLLDESIPAARAVGVIKKYSDALLEKINIFDVFRGSQIPQGKKSLALSLVFQAYDRTLNEGEIKAAIDRILNGIRTEIGGEIRG